MTVQLATFQRNNYGWKPDFPDVRDLHDEVSAEDLAAAQKVLDTRTTIDFRNSGFLTDPKDQLQLGSCTANSATSNAEYNLRREGVANVQELSRLFVYWNERFLEGTVDSDSGASIRDSVKVMHKWGAPPESEWAYDIKKFSEKPPVHSFTDALASVDLKYMRVGRTEQHIVATLLQGLCVQMGFTVYDSFESIGSNGIMPWPVKGKERILGGHANYVIGITWINGKPYWIVRNSWGKGWAESGDYYMPAEYLTKRGYASDYWKVSLVGKAA